MSRESANVLAIQFGANALGVAVGTIYARLAFAGANGERWPHFATWIAVAYGLSLVIVPPLLLRLFAPVAEALERLRKGESVPAAELARARRRALHFPRYATRVGYLAWIISASTAPAVFQYLEGSVPHVVYHAVAVALGAGMCASANLFYSMEWYLRRRILPRIPGGIEGAGGASITLKLGFLVISTGLLPLVSILWAHAFHFDSPAADTTLVAAYLIFGVLQAFAIRASIAEPVARLAEKMDRVGAGDLSARAEVSSADEIGRMADRFNAMVIGLDRARFVEETFGRYVSPAVMNEVLSGHVALGGERREATILFCDIRGFTTLSEELPPEEVVRFLNRFLDAMVETVVEHGGTVDKFIGDAILATFGVPIAAEDDARRAVAAAKAMLRRLDALNAARGKGPEIHIGIGLHTGPVVAGNVGSAKKMEYTVIGDTVNTASRIEGLTRTLGASLLASAETIARAGAAGTDRGEFELKGKSKPVRIFELAP
ncbi:MAG TPA: adenylate/guanylate cyclase domain-containing protein [bacterium]|nr:adenylate/guanylate cyclase domain-containing protein [bacterium]